MTRLAVLVVLALAPAGCKGKPARRDSATAVAPADAAAAAWPELDRYPRVEPLRVIELPARATAPRFTVGGPVLVGDLAIVSSSQFGFAAVDFRRGQLAWIKPAGARVAPPQLVDGNVVLIGDCITPPDVPSRHELLGCVRVVTRTGADQAYLAIHGDRDEVHAFAAATGAQAVFPVAPGRAVWRRGDRAVAVDLISGIARDHVSDDPPLVVAHAGRTWEIRRSEDGFIIGHENARETWRTERTYGPLLGAVYLPEQSPMIRVSSAIMHEGRPELLLFDIDATGSLHGQVSMSPVPGIGLVGHAISPVGDVALAVRLDKSLTREYVAGYAANALLMWTYPLPVVPRADPVGVAVASDAVVVFHDGDTVTVLPELSAPPTAPGAVRAPSENATP